MKLTPLEIKQQTFEKSMRGYDVSDVHSFLILVSNEVENLINKNKELEEQIDKLVDRVKHYERVEEALHETLQTTKESVANKVENARLEAKSKIQAAEQEADKIIQEANHQRQQVKQSILRLLDRRDEMIGTLSSYLENSKKSLDQFSKDEMNLFKLPQEDFQKDKKDQKTEKPKSSFSLDLNDNEILSAPVSKDSDDSGDDLDDILDQID